MATILLDTGPLVAYLNARDHHHEWAREKLATMPAPLAICEAVLTEASHLLGRSGARIVTELAQRGVFSFPFAVEREASALNRLLTKYADVPMSFADACLVRMTELVGDCAVFTTDRHFDVYRRNSRRTIPTIAPRTRS